MESKQFFIVDKVILPDSIQSVIKINEIVKKEKISIHKAIKKVGISRSTYYKYKDHVKPFFEGGQDKIFNINMSLNDVPGILSKILDIIAESGLNILTITQNIPIDGIASITLAIRSNLNTMANIEKIINKITKQPGVSSIRIIGNS